jgi:hypothetical protein
LARYRPSTNAGLTVLCDGEPVVRGSQSSLPAMGRNLQEIKEYAIANPTNATKPHPSTTRWDHAQSAITAGKQPRPNFLHPQGRYFTPADGGQTASRSPNPEIPVAPHHVGTTCQPSTSRDAWIDNVSTFAVVYVMSVQPSGVHAPRRIGSSDVGRSIPKTIAVSTDRLPPAKALKLNPVTHVDPVAIEPGARDVRIVTKPHTIRELLTGIHYGEDWLRLRLRRTSPENSGRERERQLPQRIECTCVLAWTEKSQTRS